MLEPLFTIRQAVPADIIALERFIEQSARGLNGDFYTPAQLDAVTREVFGVDSQLIADGTFFLVEHLVEHGAELVACGGWGKRSTGCGGDKHKSAPERLLDPAREAAKIRAFFVAPSMARRGIASMLLAHCERQAAAAGFSAVELVATMPGVPLYRSRGFALVEHYHLPLAVPVPVALMRRALAPS
ncbi:GNAT family N-acetyltransferase [Massilia sp. DWR3-1-1]|uniref:GNAT family N-acetyltransferase n=1 Tax=Massilia sp. DWR3-1-1 TaxID=2804559 RepID=UPI003CF1E1C2